MIDTHAHLNFAAFENDAEAVIARSLKNNIWMINIGTKQETSRKAVEIAKRYREGVYAAVGLHPLHLEKRKVDESENGFLSKFQTETEEFDSGVYQELAQSEKVVAIGEIGLDYYWKPKTKRRLVEFKQKQKEILRAQLNLAQESELPVIFHCRVAHQDLIEFLAEVPQLMPKRAVAHGFVGTAAELQKYLSFGFYIGFNGIIFKSIEGIDFERNIRETPLDKILLETDCPYLTPPQVSAERNEPFYITYIAERIAQIKNLAYEKLSEITTQNAKNLFGI